MILAALSAVAGAVFRRWFGGGFISSPRWLRVCSGFVLAMGVAWLSTGSIWGLLAGLVAAVWTVGHGSYIDMGTSWRVDNEITAQLFDRWLPNLGPTSADLVRLAILYSFFTVPAGVYLIALGFQGWFLAPAGGLAALAYWAATRLQLREPAVYGEYAAGALVYGALGLA